MAQVLKGGCQTSYQKHQAQRNRLQDKAAVHGHAADLGQRQRDQKALCSTGKRGEKQKRNSWMHGAYSLPAGGVDAALMRRGK